ncbi:MAG: DUF1549 domain-containing protein, partial [Pirellula sp.]|nr:DUF1549 domain-containing protein [Pirellula sp.]
MHKHVVLSFLIAPVFLLTGALGTKASQADDAAKVRFNRDIRPILSQACFRCHGFDEKTREAGLRLDTRDGATAAHAGDRAPIAPGDLAGSEAWSRIVSEDPDLVMPPKESNRQLTDAEKELIKRWIEQGAEYENHWSFEPIPPKANELDIDRYLDKEIAAAGIGVNQQSDPITLVRRAAFTLTGLPPSAEQVDRLVQNPNQVEYAKLVDEFLSSPHYGEEMAKHWLDVARYGDTHGLHLDNERTMWAYRDWVIQAFNKNLPYDQFTVEQLAGDLLPSPTQEQLIATGFNRCNVTTSEGGAINEEFLYRYAVDRASTTVQAWLGLTGGCAVCHDHKYDPLTTKEFYSLYSFFYSAADPAMDGNIHNTQPFLKLTSPEQKAKLDELRAKESRLRKELLEIANDPVRRADLQVGKLAAKEVSASPATTWRTEVWINDLMPAGGNVRNTSRNEETWISNKDAPMGDRYIRQTFGDKFEQFISGGWIAKDVPKDGAFSFWVRPDRYEAPEAIYVMLKVDNKSYRWVWANSLEQGRLLGGNEKSIVGPMPKPGVWTQLTIPLSELPATGSLQELQFGLFGGVADWDGFVCSGRHELIATEEPWQSWWKKQSGRSLPFADGDLGKAIKEGPESEAGKQKASEVAAYFYAYIGDEISAELLEKRAEWDETRVSIASLESEIPGTFIFKDEANPRQAHVMTRGQYDQKGEPVEP